MARKGIGQKTRFAVFSRDGFRCHYCEASAQEATLTIDHIRPVSLGGDNSIANLVTACSECNSGKSANVIPSYPLPSGPTDHSEICYGIIISSRHQVDQELARMRSFAHEIFLRKLTKHIKSVWCDSKSGIFNIETFRQNVSLEDELDIEWCASELLGVCTVFGRDIFPVEAMSS